MPSRTSAGSSSMLERLLGSTVAWCQRTSTPGKRLFMRASHSVCGGRGRSTRRTSFLRGISLGEGGGWCLRVKEMWGSNIRNRQTARFSAYNSASNRDVWSKRLKSLNTSRRGAIQSLISALPSRFFGPRFPHLPMSRKRFPEPPCPSLVTERIANRLEYEMA